MPKRSIEVTEEGKNFGRRLAQLRQTAGYSQREFAKEVGISQRMVVYYEKQTERIPVDLLPRLAKTLGVSTDQLFGMEKTKDESRMRDNRLWRRFAQVEKLSPGERKPIIQLLDAFLKKSA